MALPYLSMRARIKAQRVQRGVPGSESVGIHPASLRCNCFKHASSPVSLASADYAGLSARLASKAHGEQQPIHSYGYRAREVVDALDALYAKLRRAAK